MVNLSVVLFLCSATESLTIGNVPLYFHEQYGKSWQASPDALTALEVPPQEQCVPPPPPPECVPPPPESNPCYNLYNADRFGEVSLQRPVSLLYCMWLH